MGTYPPDWRKSAEDERRAQEQHALLVAIEKLNEAGAKAALRRIARLQRHNVFGSVVLLSSSVKWAILETAKRKSRVRNGVNDTHF